MLIENSVTRDNCSASRGSPSDAEQLPSWRNFQFAPNNHYRFFFLHTLPLAIVFKLGYVFFNQFYAEISIFSIKKCSVRLLSTTSWRHAQGCLTFPGIRRKYPEWVKIMENLVRYARKHHLYPLIWRGYVESALQMQILSKWNNIAAGLVTYELFHISLKKLCSFLYFWEENCFYKHQ